MYFRPLPVLTLIAIPMLAALVTLGAWQVERAQWKSNEIAAYEAAVSGPAQPVGASICQFATGPAPTRNELYRPVDGPSTVASLLNGWPPEMAALRMFTQDAAGNAGWRHLIFAEPPECLAGQGRLLVEGPFEPYNPAAPQGVLDAGPPPTRYMTVEWPKKPAFAALNAPETNDWHWFDAPAMEKALDVPKINDRFYMAVMPETLPAHLARTPPETHIGYAVTWYGMAVGFVVIYALFHARAGRLRFRKREPGQQ